jgi:hypothetical protein
LAEISPYFDVTTELTNCKWLRLWRMLTQRRTEEVEEVEEGGEG